MTKNEQEPRTNVYEEWISFFRVYSESFGQLDETLIAHYLGLGSQEDADSRCYACGEMWNITVTDDSYWVCRECGNTWYCDDICYQSTVLQDSANNPDWKKSEWSGKSGNSVPTPYHVTDNFVRYLNAKAQGWDFSVNEQDYQNIVEWIRSCATDPTLTQYRKALAMMGLEKHWQRRAQFMALAYPDRADEWLVMIPSTILRSIKNAHRKLAYEFYHGCASELGIKCFPHRGLTTAYLLFKWPEAHKFIQFVDFPRLRATAEKRVGHLWFMEQKLKERPHSQPLDSCAIFPVRLFYGSTRFSGPASLEELSNAWHLNEIDL